MVQQEIRAGLIARAHSPQQRRAHPAAGIHTGAMLQEQLQAWHAACQHNFSMITGKYAGSTAMWSRNIQQEKGRTV
jgi:hypothetical protein